MTEIFSNQLRAVLFVGNVNEIAALRQECGFTIQHLDYESFRSRDKSGQPYGPSNASLANITLRSISGEGYKKLYEALKLKECNAFSVLYNVKYVKNHIVDSYEMGIVLYGYIVEIEEVFDTHHKNDQSMMLNMKILLHSVSYMGENTQRKLVINS